MDFERKMRRRVPGHCKDSEINKVLSQIERRINCFVQIESSVLLLDLFLAALLGSVYGAARNFHGKQGTLLRVH